MCKGEESCEECEWWFVKAPFISVGILYCCCPRFLSAVGQMPNCYLGGNGRWELQMNFEFINA
jgi:hypothetical protein